MEKSKKEKEGGKYPENEETGSLEQLKVLININTLYEIQHHTQITYIEILRIKFI